ncbi:hypothetical protein BJY00DRAFT_189959 [Aspergillus carlsbadensis]|nr:hypothetical protein BJY00DRAFT_189959 [Aspergillus carlsbadensis]
MLPHDQYSRDRQDSKAQGIARLLDSIFHQSWTKRKDADIRCLSWFGWVPVSPLHLVIPLPLLIVRKPTVLEDERNADTKILESAFSRACTAMDHERQGDASPPVFS